MTAMLDEVWFKRDLRVVDHAALAAALRGIASAGFAPPRAWRGRRGACSASMAAGSAASPRMTRCPSVPGGSRRRIYGGRK